MLVLDHISKKSRQSRNIDDVSLHVAEGSFFGLLGTKGSGKSGIIRMCAGLERPDTGKILIDGNDMSASKGSRLRGRLTGYMGKKDGSYSGITILEYLEMYAHAAGLSGLSARQRCMELLLMGGLERRSEQFVNEQTVSIRRLLSLLRAAVSAPKLLLLDDPFAETQMAERLAMEEILANFSAEGMTIFMTSASLQEASELCKEIAIIDRGRITSFGSLNEVLKHTRSESPLYIRVASEVKRTMEILHDEAQVTAVSVDGTRFMVRFIGNEHDEAQLLAKLETCGVPVYSFYRRQSSIEDLQ